MRISFSGSRRGLSDRQRSDLASFLAANAHQITDVAHGNEAHSDTEFHGLVLAILPYVVRIHVFPSTERRSQAPIPSGAYYVASPKPPLDRNPDVVAAGPDQLVACPAELTEQQRGGTWATIRLAKRAGVPVKILWRY